MNFARACQDHTFAARIQVGTSRDGQRTEHGKCLMGKKHTNDFCVNFARTSQDHIFVARIRIGTPRDRQRNGNGKYVMDKKHKQLLCEFCVHKSESHFCGKDSSWDP